ncbi:MAG: hypothetical protein HQM00_14240 [Magnetococcales bacterium]|nr:hypothetical protein [Magnetococcales bacterium]
MMATLGDMMRADNQNVPVWDDLELTKAIQQILQQGVIQEPPARQILKEQTLGVPDRPPESAEPVESVGRSIRRMLGIQADSDRMPYREERPQGGWNLNQELQAFKQRQEEKRLPNRNFPPPPQERHPSKLAQYRDWIQKKQAGFYGNQPPDQQPSGLEEGSPVSPPLSPEALAVLGATQNPKAMMEQTTSRDQPVVQVGQSIRPSPAAGRNDLTKFLTGQPQSVRQAYVDAKSAMSPEEFRRFVDDGGPQAFLPGEKVHIPGVGAMSEADANAYVENQRFRPKTQEEKQASRHKELIANAMAGKPEQAVGNLVAMMQAGIDVPRNAIPNTIARIANPDVRRQATIVAMNALSAASEKKRKTIADELEGKRKAIADDMVLQGRQGERERTLQDQQVRQTAHDLLANYLRNHDDNAGPMSLKAVIDSSNAFDLSNPIHRSALPLIAETVVRMEQNRKKAPDSAKLEKDKIELDNARLNNARLRNEMMMLSPPEASRNGGGKILPGKYASLDEARRSGGVLGDKFQTQSGQWFVIP